MSFLMILLIITMASTIGALFFGLFALFRGGEFNQKYGNTSMRWRILLQGLALLIFTVLLMTR